MFSGKSNEWKTWKTRYISRLVIMGIFYVLDGDLKIPDDYYEIIEDTDLNTTIEQIKNDNIFLYLDMMMIIHRLYRTNKYVEYIYERSTEEWKLKISYKNMHLCFKVSV